MEHAQRYLQRKYGATQAGHMLENNQISDLDQKVIQTMGKLKQSYDHYNSKKVKTVLIEYQRLPIAPPMAKSVPKPKEPKALKVECRAIKMNGEKCKAQSKYGDFCARHSKKENN
jgi:hypothetical protein